MKKLLLTTTAAVALCACAQSASAPSAEAASAGVLSFEGSRFSLNLGCNNIFGDALVEGNKVTFGHVASTKMMCAPAEIALEDAFLKALANDEEFILERKDGRAILRSVNFSAEVVYEQK